MQPYGEQQLGTAKMLPLIIRMTLPAIAAQFINLLYSIVDRVYIGHIPEIGTDALGGIGICGSILAIIAAFSSFVSGGGAPLAAMALGRGDRQRAEKILANGVTLLLFFAVLSMTVVYSFKAPLLRMIGADNVTFKYADSYLSVYLVGTVFVMLANGLNTFISSQGRPTTAMISVLIGAVTNIILDPIFIFVLKMGVAGAAWATVLAQALSAVFVVGFLVSDKATLRIDLKQMMPDLSIIGAVAALGVAPFVMASTEGIIGFVLNKHLQIYGGPLYVSALTVLQSTMQLSNVPIMGFGQGVTPILSYNYGAGNTKRVKQGYMIMLAFIFSFNALMVISMLIFPGAYASLFTDDQKLITLVRQVMPLFISGSMIFGLQRACQNTFVALGQSKTALFIAILRKIILLVPLAIILPRFIGVKGVYLAESVADATAATICFTLFLIRFPKILKKADE